MNRILKDMKKERVGEPNETHWKGQYKKHWNWLLPMPGDSWLRYCC